MPLYDAVDPRTWPSYECRNEDSGPELGDQKTVCGCVFRVATDIDVPSLSCPWCEEGVKRISPSEREADVRGRIAALEEQRDAIDTEIESLEAKVSSSDGHSTDLRSFIELIAKVPEDVHLHVGVEADDDGGRKFGYFSLRRDPPEDGWKTRGHWSAAGSATGRRSSYSKESGLNSKSPDPYRFDTRSMRSVTFDLGDFDKIGGLVVGMLEQFLREYRDGDDPIADGGGEIIEL